MTKKYLPYVVLIAAALLLFFIKKNQRGNYRLGPSEQVTIPVKDIGFSRSADKIIYSRHARCRMDCRHIDESEVLEILQNGTLNVNRIEADERGKTFPLEGVTHDRQKVRIVFAPKQNDLVVVTVIDLDNEWPCDCK